MRNEPKIGSKAPMKTGGTGGGLSKAAVGEAMSKASPIKRVESKMSLPRAVDTKRNAKAMREMK
jgi:hypothetical protein